MSVTEKFAGFGGGDPSERILYANNPHPLGTIRRGLPPDSADDFAGVCDDSEWIWVYNDSGADIDVGLGCVRKAAQLAAKVKVAPVSADPSMLVGVVQGSTLENGYCGWIKRKGPMTIAADAAGISVNIGIMPSNATAGKFESNAGGQAAVGCGHAGAAIAGAASGYAIMRFTG